MTNSKPLQERINHLEDPNPASPPQQDELTYSETTLGATQPAVGEQRVLGVTWSTESDRLMFDVTELAKLALDLCQMKRNVVSLIGKFL